MGFKLVNIDGRAALTDKDLYYDLETISNGLLSSNTDEVLDNIKELNNLYAKIENLEPFHFEKFFSKFLTFVNCVNLLLDLMK